MGVLGKSQVGMVVMGALACAIFGLVAVLWVRDQIRKLRLRGGGSLAGWLRLVRGQGLGLAELSRRLGLPEAELLAFTPTYTARQIPKRSGGVRTLHVPDGKTKDLQRRILRRLLAKLRAHPAAHGFERGRSIVTNAREHVGQSLLVKVDVKDFFPSTREDRIVRYFQVIGWDRRCALLLARLCCHEGGLPQGAPTSPRLSNLVNRGLDRKLERYARRCRARYTRYADDITFSSTWRATSKPGSLARGLVQGVRRRLKSEGYQLNASKVRIVRAHQQMRVTGLVVNAKVNLPRRIRRKLRAAEHRLSLSDSTGPNPTLSKAQLAGWRGLRAMVELQRVKPDGDGATGP